MILDFFREMKLKNGRNSLISALESSINSTRKIIVLAKMVDQQALLEIANFNLYLLLFFSDFQYVFTDLLLEKKDKKRNLLARQLSLAMFEFLNTIGTVKKEVWNEINDSAFSKNIKNESKAIGKFISKLQKDHSAFLNEIRNAAAAHRNQDSLKQLEIIEQTDIDKILDLAQEVSCVCTDLYTFWSLAVKNCSQRIINKSN